METRRGECCDLMSPGIRQFGPAVAKHDQRAFSLFKQKNVDPVGDNDA
jgi:hypothetical protein